MNNTRSVNCTHRARNTPGRVSSSCSSSSSSGIGAPTPQRVRRACIVAAATAAAGDGERLIADNPQQPTRRGVLAAAAIVAALAAADTTTTTTPAAHAALLVDEAASTAAFDAARAAVVAVGVAGPGIEGGAVPTAALEPLGSGTVFALADGGRGGAYIVTNYHVISKYVLDRNAAGGLRVVASCSDGGGGGGADSIVLTANIIGADANRDLAVLLAEGPLPAEARLRPLPVGASEALKIGQTVYALGARYGGTGADGTAGGGGGPTMSAGVVSGLQRAIPTPVGTRVYGCVQVDAVVNAANSGGPLVDSNGRLVGLSTAPFTSKNLGRGGGVNFALPSELLVETVPNLIVYGNASARGVRAAAPSS